MTKHRQNNKTPSDEHLALSSSVSPPPPSFPAAVATSPPLLTTQLSLSPTPVSYGGDYGSADDVAVASVFFPSSSDVHFHRIRVRHEESKRKLQAQLAAICGHSNHSITEENDVAKQPVTAENSINNSDSIDTMDSSVQHDLVQNLEERLDVNVSLDDIPAENVAVRISKDHIFIESIMDKGKYENITAISLPSGLDSEVVSCTVSNGILHVKQNTEKCCVLEYPNNPAVYLPVIQEDVDVRKWRVILHVPGCYDACTDLVVKTVDETTLIISWSIPGKSAALKVKLEVPDRVMMRTLTGAASEHGQLVIEAQIGKTRSRCQTL